MLYVLLKVDSRVMSYLYDIVLDRSSRVVHLQPLVAEKY